MTCLFCRIVAREMPAQIVFENDHVLAFRDIHPAAPTHVLIIPKAHLSALTDAEPAHRHALGELFLAARAVAEKENVAHTGFRVVMNTGKHANQTVHHVHLHVMGGREMSWPPG